MRVTNEKTENSQTFLTIEMEPAEMEESLEKSYRRLVKRTRIPGFRPGKAPRAILEHYLGREELVHEALNELLPEAYEKAVKEQGLEAVARPEIEVTQPDPLVFKAIVPLVPRVKLGDYHHLQVSPVEPAPVTDDDIKAVIEVLRHQQATWEPVERPTEFGDLVALDVWSNVGDKPFLNQKGAQYQVLRDASFPAPGFSEQLLGVRKDEEKEFELEFPSDYPQRELAGKGCHFRVRLGDVKREVLPDLNDELARAVAADLTTVEALRERVTADLRLRAEARARMDFEEKVIDAVVNLAEVEFPPVLVETEISHLLDQRFQQTRADLDAYLRSVNKTEEEVREELRPPASQRVTRSLVLGKVAEEEKIEVSDAEVDAEIEKIKEGAGENREKLGAALNTAPARESIRETLLTRKTIGRLTELAGGSEATKTTDKEEER